MPKISRFGVSLEEDLLRSFDRSIGDLGYANRSEAIRDLIRDHLIQKESVRARENWSGWLAWSTIIGLITWGIF